MASRSQHQAQWEHNRSFLAELARRENLADWIATVAFYTAVHAVQVLLVTDGNNRAVSHDTRNQILISTRRYDKVWPDYKALFDASCAARYDCSGWLAAEAVRDELIRMRLLRLEERVIRLAKLPLVLPDLFATPYGKPTAT